MPTLPYLVFRRRRGRVIWPRGGSGRGIPVSRSKTGWGLHSTPVTLPRRGAAAVCRVDHSRAIHPYSHRATPASGQFIMILRLGGHASRVIRSHALRQAPRSSVKKYRAPAITTLEGTVAKVEYTFQYKRGADGNLKIVVHHSSLPYSP